MNNNNKMTILWWVLDGDLNLSIWTWTSAGKTDYHL